MSEPLTLSSLLGAVGGLAALQFLITLWLGERFRAQMQKESSQFIESLKWDVRVREQAAQIAEYLSIARSLDGKNLPETYRKANELSWQLALWLPAETYRELLKHLTSQAGLQDYSILISVRKSLLGEKAGDLAPGEVILHAPGIAKHKALVRSDA